jgi:hypothetical protein
MLSILFIFIQCLFSKHEQYQDFKKKRVHGGKVQLGFVRDTSPELKSITTELQKLGGQLHENTRYDHVATGYLDHKNIK